MKAIIIGATSGIGLEVARKLHKDGWTLGIAGRREELLHSIQKELELVTSIPVTNNTPLRTQHISDSANFFTNPECDPNTSKNNIAENNYLDSQSISPKESNSRRVYIRKIDVSDDNSSEQLLSLIHEMNGTDLIFIASGYGTQNLLLDEQIEITTARTNVEGFIRMITTAFKYFESCGSGHIAAITSIGATKGLGSAAAYSSTKRFQSNYIQSLAQLSHIKKANIRFTEIRPGFVDTAFLKYGHYPMLLRPEKVACSIVRALKHHRRKIIIDWRYTIVVALWHLIPNFLWERLSIKNQNH